MSLATEDVFEGQGRFKGRCGVRRVGKRLPGMVLVLQRYLIPVDEAQRLVPTVLFDVRRERGLLTLDVRGMCG